MTRRDWPSLGGAGVVPAALVILPNSGVRGPRRARPHHRGTTVGGIRFQRLSLEEPVVYGSLADHDPDRRIDAPMASAIRHPGAAGFRPGP